MVSLFRRIRSCKTRFIQPCSMVISRTQRARFSPLKESRFLSALAKLTQEVEVKIDRISLRAVKTWRYIRINPQIVRKEFSLSYETELRQVHQCRLWKAGSEYQPCTTQHQSSSKDLTWRSMALVIIFQPRRMEQEASVWTPLEAARTLWLANQKSFSKDKFSGMNTLTSKKCFMTLRTQPSTKVSFPTRQVISTIIYRWTSWLVTPPLFKWSIYKTIYSAVRVPLKMYHHMQEIINAPFSSIMHPSSMWDKPIWKQLSIPALSRGTVTRVSEQSQDFSSTDLEQLS